MLNLKDFDYILWKDSEGRCFVKVKFTDEVTEVSEQVFKDLRNEEKRIYRELELKDKLYSENEEERAKASVMFPSSYFCEIETDENEGESFVLMDICKFEDEVIAKDLEERFANLLTDNQKEIFFCVMLGGEKIIDYAERKGIKQPSVIGTIKKIRKKIKKFYLGG
ncbi:MAG: hypothetical protein E7538_00115 [Ruminococcaceae bacterium]|nr:hypothetical protein [Oscillospiraceae bacterium]